MYVEPSARGKGVGRTILRGVERARPRFRLRGTPAGDGCALSPRRSRSTSRRAIWRSSRTGITETRRSAAASRSVSTRRRSRGTRSVPRECARPRRESVGAGYAGAAERRRDADERAACRPALRGARDRAADGRRHRGRARDRHLEAAGADRARHPRQRLREHRVVRVGDHLHRRRGRHPPVPRHRHRGARRRCPSRRSSRRRTCSSTASCPPRAQLDEFRYGIRKHTLRARGREALLRRLPEGRPPDGHAVVGGHARCRPSTRTASTPRTPSRRSSRSSG